MGFEVTLDIPARSLNAGHLSLSAEIATSQLAQRTMQARTIPLNLCYFWDAIHSRIGATPSSDDLALITGTPGTDAPTLQAGDLKSAGATTRKTGFTVDVPSNYDDGATFEVRFLAGMETNNADTSCTIDLEVYKDDGTGAVGSDLCQTAAQSINGGTPGTPANFDFTIDETGIDPGDILNCIVSIACNDGATGTAVTPVIYAIIRRCDLRG